MSNQATLYLDPEQIDAIREAGKGSFLVPIPTGLMTIQRLNGERSAWTVENYMQKGKPYRKWTRLNPLGKHPSAYVDLKVKRARSHLFCHLDSYKVTKQQGVWMWRVFVTVLTSAGGVRG